MENLFYADFKPEASGKKQAHLSFQVIFCQKGMWNNLVKSNRLLRACSVSVLGDWYQALY